MPQLVFARCASAGRARRLWAARYSQSEAQPPGAPPQPRGLLERAASKVADSTAFGHPGTRHRGLGNSSSDERPLLYITYARPFWVDVYNFDSKRYTQLPEVEVLSREERMQKRKRG